MNPYPFESLNHLTVPVAIQTPPPPRKNGQGKRTVRNQYSLRYRHTVPRQTATSAPSARLGGTGGPDRSRAVEEEGGGDCGGLFDSEPALAHEPRRSDEQAAEQPVEDLGW